MLKKMCRKHKLLPSSYAITSELKRTGELPFGSGGYADVWCGLYRDSKVAIKVLRVHPRVDPATMERVRLPTPLLICHVLTREWDSTSIAK
jgi:hypothetical protein